ncbi:MAG TPA: hypothetical protein PK280_00990 [Planctomycetota bacterium]|nr:hypothetical protein [Planctomycetota bacterium]
MPEIPQNLPSAPGPAFSLPEGALPAGLKAGDSLSARVLAQVAAGRFALSIGGREVLADSAAALSPGDQLRLVVRQAGSRVLMDLIPMVREDASGAAAPASGQGAAPRGLQEGLQSFLGGRAAAGELLAEASRLLAAGGTDDLAARAGALAAGPAAAAAGAEPSAGLAGAVAALPAQVGELLAAVEARMAEAVRALPQAAALDALANLLASLPAAERGSPGGAPDPRQLAGLLDRLLADLRAQGGPDAPAAGLAPGLRAELGALGPRELADLRLLAAERERAALAASPQVAALAGAHRALTAAQDRLDAARLWSLSASGPGGAFSYVELPGAGGPDGGTAALRVLVRRSGDGTGSGAGSPGRGRGSVRAVLDLDLSALGEVRSELALSGRSLAVKLELPDRERGDHVAASLGELEDRLTAHGFEASVSSTVTAGRRRRGGASDLPEAEGAAGGGGLDLWA